MRTLVPYKAVSIFKRSHLKPLTNTSATGFSLNEKHTQTRTTTENQLAPGLGKDKTACAAAVFSSSENQSEKLVHRNRALVSCTYAVRYMFLHIDDHDSPNVVDEMKTNSISEVQTAAAVVTCWDQRELFFPSLFTCLEITSNSASCY